MTRASVNYIYSPFAHLLCKSHTKILYSRKIVPHLDEISISLGWQIINPFSSAQRRIKTD